MADRDITETDLRQLIEEALFLYSEREEDGETWVYAGEQRVGIKSLLLSASFKMVTARIQQANKISFSTDKESNFPETFYESDRSAAKGHASYPLTLGYITRLETVVKVAIAFPTHAHNPSHAEANAKNDALNDALSTINFLDESM